LVCVGGLVLLLVEVGRVGVLGCGGGGVVGERVVGRCGVEDALVWGEGGWVGGSVVAV